MRHQQDRARERFQRLLEGLAALEVEVVRRLVEHEKVRSGRDHECEREPPPLAARDLGDGLVLLLPAREEEAAEEAHRLWPFQARRLLRALEDAAGLVQLDLVLGEVRGHYAVTEPDRAGERLAAVEQRLEERRLAGPVRADEPHVLAALERQPRVVEQLLVAGRDPQSLGLDHGSAAPGRVEEVETELPPAHVERLEHALRLAPLSFEAADLRQLRLRLLRLVLLVPEALDEALEPLDVDGEAIGGLARGRGAGGLLDPPFVPRAGEVDGLATAELEHAVRDGLEEPAVVRDEDDPRVQRLQLLLEPLQVGDVEVVRRLVE